MSFSLFKISDSFIVKQTVALRGSIEKGVVRKGMVVKVLLDSECYLTANIKGVEFVCDVGLENPVAIILDVSEVEVQKLWLELCQNGDILKVEEANAT